MASSYVWLLVPSPSTKQRSEPANIEVQLQSSGWWRPARHGGSSEGNGGPKGVQQANQKMLDVNSTTGHVAFMQVSSTGAGQIFLVDTVPPISSQATWPNEQTFLLHLQVREQMQQYEKAMQDPQVQAQTQQLSQVMESPEMMQRMAKLRVSDQSRINEEKCKSDAARYSC